MSLSHRLYFCRINQWVYRNIPVKISFISRSVDLNVESNSSFFRAIRLVFWVFNFQVRFQLTSAQWWNLWKKVWFPWYNIYYRRYKIIEDKKLIAEGLWADLTHHRLSIHWLSSNWTVRASRWWLSLFKFLFCQEFIQSLTFFEDFHALLWAVLNHFFKLNKTT